MPTTAALEGSAPLPASEPASVETDSLHRELAVLEGDASHRAWTVYARRMIAVAAGLLLLVATINFVVDPRGVWGVGLFRVDPRDSRDVKLTMLDHAGPFDTVVLGSSRSERIPPGLIRRLTGRTAFNAGIDGTGTVAMRQIWNRALADDGPHLRHVLMLLDIEALREPTPIPDTAENLRRLLSFKELQTSVGVVAGKTGAHSIERKLLRNEQFAATDAPDGHELYRPGVDFAAANRQGGPTPAKLQLFLRDYRPDWGPLVSANERAFISIVRSANSHGIAPVIVLPPYHPRFLAMAGAQWQAAHRRALAYLASLQGLRFRLIDASHIESFGGTPRDFNDAVHPGDTNSRRLLELIFRRDGSAL